MERRLAADARADGRARPRRARRLRQLGVNRHNNVNPFWLTQYLDMHHCYVVVPREGDIALYTGLVNHVPNAREVAAETPVVEWGGYEPGETVAARLRELGARRVGLVGVAATWKIGMPYRHFESLRGFETVDVTREFAALRKVKSARGDRAAARRRGADRPRDPRGARRGEAGRCPSSSSSPRPRPRTAAAAAPSGSRSCARCRWTRRTAAFPRRTRPSAGSSAAT